MVLTAVVPAHSETRRASVLLVLLAGRPANADCLDTACATVQPNAELEGWSRRKKLK